MSGWKIPCPCGSGKRYEQCCGKASNVVYLNQARLRKVSRNLRRRLGDYVNRREFNRDAVRAQELYFKHMGDNAPEFDEEFLLERCFEWFIFDFRLPEGDRIIERFSRSAVLSEDEKHLLRAWAQSPNSLYLVKAVMPHKLLLEDLLLRRTLVVTDSSAAKELEPGYVLYMRVLPVGLENEFSTGGLALPPESREILLQRIYHDAARFWRTGNFARDWRLYLQERSHVVNGMILQVTADPRPAEKEHDIECTPAAPEDFPWRKSCYKQVARSMVEELYAFKYSCHQVNNALRLWYDFTSLEQPSFRKPETWVAALVYTVSRLEGDYRQNQHSLADRYGVSPSTISDKYRSICQILGLEKHDKRYSTGSNQVQKRGAKNTVTYLWRHLLFD